MYCPKCAHKQLCPCHQCIRTNDPHILPWIWFSDEIITCANCGLTQTAEWWETLAQNCFEENVYIGSTKELAQSK